MFGGSSWEATVLLRIAEQTNVLFMIVAELGRDAALINLAVARAGLTAAAI